MCLSMSDDDLSAGEYLDDEFIAAVLVGVDEHALSDIQTKAIDIVKIEFKKNIV